MACIAVYRRIFTRENKGTGPPGSLSWAVVFKIGLDGIGRHIINKWPRFSNNNGDRCASDESRIKRSLYDKRENSLSKELKLYVTKKERYKPLNSKLLKVFEKSKIHKKKNLFRLYFLCPNSTNNTI
jgi:hypothetical protein